MARIFLPQSALLLLTRGLLPCQKKPAHFSHHRAQPWAVVRNVGQTHPEHLNPKCLGYISAFMSARD